MKKRVLIVFALLAIVGVSAVFAQVTINGMRRQTNDRGYYPFDVGSAQYAEVVGFVVGQGSTVRNIGDTRVTSTIVPPRGIWEGYTLHDKLIVVTTAAQGYFTFITHLDQRWYRPTTNTRVWVIGPNSRVEFHQVSGQTLQLYVFSGEIREDASRSLLIQTDEILTYLASVNEDNWITNKVAQLKRSNSKYNNNPELLARDATESIRASARIQSALMGVHLFLIPLSYWDTVTQWIYKAEIAYAVAEAYGRRPNRDLFKRHLAVLLSDESAIATAARGRGTGINDHIDEATLDSLGSAFVQDLVTGKVTGAIGKKLVQESAAEVAGKVIGPIAGAVTGGALNARETGIFLDRCIYFYGRRGGR